MKYKQFKNSLMRVVAKNMINWNLLQGEDYFNISFNSASEERPVFIWSVSDGQLNRCREFTVKEDKFYRTFRYEDVYKVYPLETLNHKYSICIEFKNGTSTIIGR